MRSLLRSARSQLHGLLGGPRRARARLDDSCGLILMYHRVLPREDAARLAVEPGMFVTPATFEMHMEQLQEHFSVLPLAELVARLQSRKALPPRACAITFDDGWLDNFTYAFPALARHGLPATVFVVSNRVGTAGAFWPDEVCRRVQLVEADAGREIADRIGASSGVDPSQRILSKLKTLQEGERESVLELIRAQTPDPVQADRELLNWEEIDEMARSLISVESHGATHAILTGLPADRAAIELREARRTLRERGHGSEELLAYPSGAFDSGIMKSASEVGYRAAVSTVPALASTKSDAMALPRVGLHEDISSSHADFLYRVPGSAVPDAGVAFP